MKSPIKNREKTRVVTLNKYSTPAVSPKTLPKSLTWHCLTMVIVPKLRA